MKKQQLTSKTAIAKAIMTAIKNNDKTEFFHIYAKVTGKCNYHVYGCYWYLIYFIRDYVSGRATMKAQDIILHRNVHETCRMYRDNYKYTDKQRAMTLLREWIADNTSNYAKKPMYGFTHLYFAHPYYKHDDYNKRRSVEIKGNERFCELIVKLGEKYPKSSKC